MCSVLINDKKKIPFLLLLYHFNIKIQYKSDTIRYFTSVDISTDSVKPFRATDAQYHMNDNVLNEFDIIYVSNNHSKRKKLKHVHMHV